MSRYEGFNFSYYKDFTNYTTRVQTVDALYVELERYGFEPDVILHVLYFYVAGFIPNSDILASCRYYANNVRDTGTLFPSLPDIRYTDPLGRGQDCESFAVTERVSRFIPPKQYCYTCSGFDLCSRYGFDEGL